MVSKAKVRLVRLLEMKRHREAHGLFVAEGNKLVADMMAAFECEWMLATPSWMAVQGHIPARELVVADGDDIRRISLLKNPQDVLALFRLPSYDIGEADPAHRLTLVLDAVRDPGNLGTIVRVADWFGIEHVICSTDSADVFAPKAVQATMGALARVSVHYTGIEQYLDRYRHVPVYGTFTDGDNIYGKTLSPGGIVVLGNEGSGIRPSVEALVHCRLCIPSYPDGRDTSESLNVAVAAAVVCAEFRRQTCSRQDSGF
ncbi:MAG: RNA methyltransferase [Tannerella sp.]|jgi:TrmH family RNA methyltransferase|nr:RNA methyltransferase [Tannerella sp.]